MIIRGQHPDRLSQRLPQRRRAAVLLQQVPERFLGKLVDIAAALSGKTGDGMPSGATKGNTPPHLISLRHWHDLQGTKHERRCCGQKAKRLLWLPNVN